MRWPVFAEVVTCALLVSGCFVFPDFDDPDDQTSPHRNNGVDNNGVHNPDGPDEPVITGPPNFSLDCTDPAAYPSDDVLEAWGAEAGERPDRGRPATFDLRGNPFQVTGSSRVDLRGELRFLSPPTAAPDQQFLFFPDARTSEGDGLLVLEMEAAPEVDGVPMFELRASAAEILQASTDELSTNPRFSALLTGEYPGSFPANAPDDWSAARNAWENALASDSTVSGVEVPAYRRAVILPAQGEPIRLRPDEAISIEVAGRLVVGAGTRIEQDVAAAIDATFLQFGVAGEFTEGGVDADDFPDGPPNALFGRDAVVAIDEAGVASSEAWVTQGVNSGGLVYPAAVEVAPNRDFEIEIPHGESRRVTFHYRETTFLGDAVLGEVLVEPESAGEMVELTLASGLMIDALVQWVVDAGYAWPIAAVGATIIAPFVVIADVIGCFLGKCPMAPAPFPSWMDAGAVGSFEVEFDGDVDPGVYDITLKFVGRNYCEVPVEVTVVVL